MHLLEIPSEVLAAEIAALADKYAVMRALRAAHGVDPPREAIRALAMRFPGSLAELDRIAPELLDARVVESAALAVRRESRREAIPRWALGWIAVHRGLRGALAIKRRLGGARALSAATRAWMIALLARDGTDEERCWLDELALIANPPDGRLLDLVLARAAIEIAHDGDMRTLLMPRPARVSGTRSP